jgi:hypothetical protein
MTDGKAKIDKDGLHLWCCFHRTAYKEGSHGQDSSCSDTSCALSILSNTSGPVSTTDMGGSYNPLLSNILLANNAQQGNARRNAIIWSATYRTLQICVRLYASSPLEKRNCDAKTKIGFYKN